MKHIPSLIYSLIFVITLSIFPQIVQAQEDPYTLAPEAGQTTQSYDLGETAQNNFGGILANVIQFIFVIAVILALGFLVYGGIKWLTSGGDKEGVASARGTIIAAIIGLVVIFLAYVILNFVILFLTGEGLGSIVIPGLTDPAVIESTNEA